ncbi:MAG: hypothetical protein ACRENF_03750, partial [Thermodesulfobacteriota bacterium]
FAAVYKLKGLVCQPLNGQQALTYEYFKCLLYSVETWFILEPGSCEPLPNRFVAVIEVVAGKIYLIYVSAIIYKRGSNKNDLRQQ